jgi:hypothetical protein
MREEDNNRRHNMYYGRMALTKMRPMDTTKNKARNFMLVSKTA